MLEKAISAVVKWLAEHVSPRYLSVVALMTGLLLFLPQSALHYFGLDVVAAKWRGTISIAFFVSVFLTATYPIERGYRTWAEKKRIRHYLNDLPVFESSFVRRCLLNSGRADNVTADEGIAKSLERKGILWCSTNWGGAGRAGKGYCITDAAYSVLKEDKLQKLFVREKHE